MLKLDKFIERLSLKIRKEERERIIKDIESLAVAKPNSEGEENRYHIKDVFLEEIKRAILERLNNL